ncbi:MAG: NYN domain-containing protein [Lachnospiraceae bacterium]|nr:NYN domain-containing protein [Lachnospiraceae bacterium]
MEDINIALLIDADNISAKYISTILSELSKYGKITIRRMYGDWSQDRLHSWFKVAAGHSLTPIMQPNNTPGKNASDIGLIIDAMDILYTGEVQGFCIVSSDGDFNKLATRLREAGKVVIGMGEKKTPESFRASCERFIFLDVIGNNDEDEETVPAKKVKAKDAKDSKQTKKKGAAETAASAASTGRKKAGTAAGSSSVSAYDAGGTDEFLGYTPSDYDSDQDPEGESLFTDQSKIEEAIIAMIADNNADGKETGLGEIGSRLLKLYPDFDIRNYHYSKLSEYLKDFPSLSVTNKDNNVWVSLNISSDAEIERQILSVFKRHGVDDMNISELKAELEEMNPNLEASIRRSGVTKFSVYLNRKIRSVEVNGRHVTLKK